MKTKEFNKEITSKVDQIKKETGAIKVYVDDRYSNPVFIPIFNEVQADFLKECFEEHNLCYNVLIRLFSSKSDDIKFLRNSYSNMRDEL